MTRRARWLTAGAIALLALGLAIGLSLAYGGGPAPQTSGTATVSAEALQSLFEEAAVGQKESDVLARFPSPYQHYKDNLGEDCFEWRGANLYNICFRAGVLHLKATF